jgi:hypothetical protein
VQNTLPFQMTLTSYLEGINLWETAHSFSFQINIFDRNLNQHKVSDSFTVLLVNQTKSLKEEVL